MTGLKRYLMWSAAIVLVYLVAQYYKPRPTDWTTTYFKEDKIPFGTYILYQELPGIFPGASISPSRLPVYNTLKDKNFTGSNYLLIAGEVKMDEYDYAELVRYMEKGNNVFIAAYQLGGVLRDTLHLSMNSVYNFSDEKDTRINFVNPMLKTKDGYVFNKGLSNQYFSKVDTLRASALGRNGKGDVSYLKYRYGKGGLYILPSPQLLSNYNLLNPLGADYVAKILSFLPKSKQIIWDEYSTKGNVDEGSELRVLLRNAGLRWAYYLALAGLLIFVAFEMKRRQRVIPVIEPLKNTSVDFVTVVGKVYYQQRDNRDIAHKKVNYLLEQIRTTYRIKTTQLDDAFVADLVLRSGISEDFIRELITSINRLKGAAVVSDQELIHLNHLIEKFYKQAQ